MGKEMNSIVSRFILCFSVLWTVHAIWFYFISGPDSKFLRFDPRFSTLMAIAATLLAFIAGQILRIECVRKVWEKSGLWRLSILLLGVGVLVGHSIVQTKYGIWISWVTEASFVLIGFPVLYMTHAPTSKVPQRNS